MALRLGRRRTRTLRRCVWCVLAVVAFVLASTEVWGVRTGSAFVTINAAEALYASALYFVMRVVFPVARPVWVAVAAFGVAMAVGLSALYTTSWLDRGRDTLFVRVLAGDSIERLDLLRAGAGVVGAWVVDGLIVMWMRAPRRRRSVRR